MKLIVIAALVLGAVMLFGTRRDTPFIRWGVIVAMLGVLLTLTTALFTVRGIAFGTILAVAGVALYYYGRVARKERIFISHR